MGGRDPREGHQRGSGTDTGVLLPVCWSSQGRSWPEAYGRLHRRERVSPSSRLTSTLRLSSSVTHFNTGNFNSIFIFLRSNLVATSGCPYAFTIVHENQL
uniref:Putative Benzoyl coenzyme A: Benzyl alcohol benzoyl transferase n=1 Tax=Davidia involucrata TaxID=16924 RepID=A0A5B6ZKD1_DAVIN